MTAGTATVPRLAGTRRRELKPVVFAAALWACLAIASLFLLFVMINITVNGLARFDPDLFLKAPSTLFPATAGVRPAILGTLWVIGLMVLIVMPRRVRAAV